MEAAVAAMALGTGLEAVGQYKSMKQQKAYAEYSQDTALRGAAQAEAVGEYNAGIIEKQAKRDKLNAQKEFSREQGRRRLAAGSSGATPNLDLLNDYVAENEVNQSTIDYNARVLAAQARYAGQVQAGQLRDQAAVYGWQARSLQSSIPLAVGTTLLAGGAKAWMAGSDLYRGSSSSSTRLSDGGFLKSRGGSYGGFGR